MDTRKHTQHFLRPPAAEVEAFIQAPTNAQFKHFANAYRAALHERFARNRAPFDELAKLAAEEDVFLGCNCPTRWNPDVNHCHTTLALAFMKRKYPKLSVRMP